MLSGQKIQDDAMVADPVQTHVAKEFKHTSPFICCRFDPMGRYVFGTAEDGSIQRWELASEKKTELRRHESWVYSLAFLPDGETLLSGGGDGRLIWWPATAEEPKPTRVLRAHKGWIRFLAVSPDGSLIASGGNDDVVRLWRTDDGTLVRELTGHKGDVYSTFFHPSGQFVLAGDLMGEVRQWETKTGKYVRSFDAAALHTYNAGQRVHYGGVRNLSLSPDGRFLAGCGLHKATNPLGAVNEPLVLVFDWESGEKKHSLAAEGVQGIGWRFLFHSQGFLVGASAGIGGFLSFWQLDEPKEFHRFKLPNNSRNMDLHPDAIQVATADADAKVRISRMEKKPEKKDGDSKKTG